MKNLSYIFTGLLLCFLFANSSAQDRKLVILHTNDLHSRLDGFAPSSAYTPGSINDDKTLGGFSRIANLISKEREANPGSLLVVDDGDFLMGTIFHFMEEYNGFQLPLMKKMGYDFVALGNHEFDFGTGKLSLIIDKSVERGPIPELLLSNAVLSETDKRDDGIEKPLLYSHKKFATIKIAKKDHLPLKNRRKMKPEKHKSLKKAKTLYILDGNIYYQLHKKAIVSLI